MKQKKAQDFLNIVELIIFACSIFVGVYFLSVANFSNNEEANQNIGAFQFEHKVTQALRTLAQTPLEIQGEQMSFAQASNHYMSQVDYLIVYGPQLTSQEKNRVQREITLYQEALKNRASQTILPVFSAKNHEDTNFFESPLSFKGELFLRYVLLDEKDSRRELLLGIFEGKSLQDHQQITGASISMPAYFEHSFQLIGSYRLELEVVTSSERTGGRLQ